MNKYLIPPLLLTLFLQGCGSSSSDTPDIPVEPVEYTFSLTAQLTNDCGVASAFTDVELLLQDDTWQTLDTYQADVNGLITFVTESEFINYTLVAKDQQGTEAEGLNVVSYYQANSATPSHYQAQFDNKLDDLNEITCECVKQDLKLTHRSFAAQTSVTSSLDFASSSIIDSGTTLFEGVRACKTLDGVWPLSSFSISGRDINEKSIGVAGFIDEFTVNDEGLWLLSALEFADEFQLTPPYQETSTNQIIQGTEHFSVEVAKDEQSLLIFDTHPYVSEAYYQSHASVTFVPSDSIFRSSVIKNHHQIISPSAEESLSIMASEYQPAFNEPYFDEINADGSYDYSAVAGYPMAIINFTFTAYDPDTKLLMPAKWTFYGADKGVLAISAPLTGYEDIINLDTNIESTNVRLIKSNMNNDYQDYIKHYQGDSALDVNNDFVRNMTAAELALKF
ncbi:hypothetical protein CXF85_01420 [Colwellia sp. 75C3]|uniref:hypothetical protein n=1 Tax=Colwellia sp. 75C3 TaxID=888425 RepID=UPI000C3376F2|nr:hypothetical protein [Colwellia sp. 75C3]PKG86390.1 hypothetical protein CXF85_01420 [Colwellia sp. 75C3]